MSTKKVTYYSKLEETANVVTHGAGLILSFPALFYLVYLALEKGTTTHLFSFVTFGICMIILYAASTFYHAVQEEKLRRKLNIFDHAAIFVLIAGSYTPFMLLGLEGTWKWAMFILTWSIAIAGIIFKLFYTGRFNKASTFMYIAAGWVVVIAYKPLGEGLPADSIKWAVIGGLSYTVGAFLYMIKKIPYNHAIFHLFALGGTISHFIAVTYLV